MADDHDKSNSLSDHSADELLPNVGEADSVGISFTISKLAESLQIFRDLIRSLGLPKDDVQDLEERLVKLHSDTIDELNRSLIGVRDTVQIQAILQIARRNFIQDGLQIIEARFPNGIPDTVKFFKQAQQLYEPTPDGNSLGGGRLRSNSVRVESFSFVKRYHPRTWTKERAKYYFLKRVPLIGWVRNYGRYDVFYDLFAAFTVLCTVIPQGIGYALIAGLPAVFGLYAGFTPAIIYTFLGTSKELCVGPVSMISIVISDAFANKLIQQSDQWVVTVLFVGFLAGIFLLIARIIQIGFLLENLFSLPILNGFTCGAGLLILFSQVKNLLGFKSFSSTASTFPDYVEGFNDHIGETQLYTSILGFLTIGVLFAMKYLWRVFPAAFIMLIITTAIVYITEADQRAGIKILRSNSFIPEGLPNPQVPWEYRSATLDNTPISFESIIETSLIIALVGYMESASVAKKFAAKNHYRIHLSQEMLALSACSTIGSFFQSYPTTGSLSRTALKYQCGSRSPFSSIFSGIMMGAVLLFVTPAFQFVPLTVISAIVIVAISALIDYEEPLFLWRTNKIELIPYTVTFWATMLLGPEIGVVIAVILSMFQVMWFTAHPRIVKIGRLAGTYAYRDLTRFPNAQTFPGVLIIRQDARLYFANVTRLRDKMERFIRASQEPIKYVILDASGINSLDATAVAFIDEMVINFKKQNIVWLFATVKGPVRDHMAEVKLDKKIGEQHFFLSVHDAVLYTQSTKQTGLSKPESDVKVNIN